MYLAMGLLCYFIIVIIIIVILLGTQSVLSFWILISLFHVRKFSANILSNIPSFPCLHSLYSGKRSQELRAWSLSVKDLNRSCGNINSLCIYFTSFISLLCGRWSVQCYLPSQVIVFSVVFCLEFILSIDFIVYCDDIFYFLYFD